mgnify:FL=1|jgi:hypothetical protein
MVRTWCMRVVGGMCGALCMYLCMGMYVWCTSSTWEWARMVCVLPMVVCMVVGMWCVCAPWCGGTAHRGGYVRR